MASGNIGTGNIRTLIVPAATKFNTEVVQDENILACNLLITTAHGGGAKRIRGAGTYTVEICFDTAGTFSIVCYDDGTAMTGKVNASSNLEADEVFTFTKLMPETWDNSTIGSGDPITTHLAGLNFRFSESATLKWMVTTVHGGVY